MLERLQHFFSSEDFMPHGHCFLWLPEILWLHVIADALIALAYFSIPAALIYFARKRRDIPFRPVFLLFGAFITFCGLTHLTAIWTLWQPFYGFEGTIKGLTAIASVATAVVIWRIMPQALALPTPVQLAKMNEELRSAYASVEARVEERTTDLTEANARLAAEISRSEQRGELLKESQAKLEEAWRSAEAANRVKADFFANMSHELRTPMNAIIGLSQVLSMSDPLSARQRECIATLSLSAQNLMTMLNNLLTVTQPGSEPAPAHLPPAPRGEQSASRRGHVLVIDDTNANILVGSLMLEQLGYTYDSASGGEEALRRIEQKRYDAVLMDIRMPGMDGLETTQRLRALERERGLRHTPVVAVTAYATRADEDKCLAAGMDGYLTKPINADALAEMLAKVAGSDKSSSNQ